MSRQTIDTILAGMHTAIKQRVRDSVDQRYLLSAFGPITAKAKNLAVEEAAKVVGRRPGRDEGWIPLLPTGAVKMRPIDGPPGVTFMQGIGADARGGDGISVSSDISANLVYAAEYILDKKTPRLALSSDLDRRVLVVSKTRDDDMFATAEVFGEALRAAGPDGRVIDVVLFATMFDDSFFNDSAEEAVISGGTVQVLAEPGKGLPSLTA